MIEVKAAFSPIFLSLYTLNWVEKVESVHFVFVEVLGVKRNRTHS